MMMPCKSIFSLLLLLFFGCAACESAWGELVIHSKTAVNIELTGYNGLVASSIFKGYLAADGKREINTIYRGLALLIFPDGQRYPVIIGEESFTLKIDNPAEPPSFADSDENDFFYSMLAGKEPDTKQYSFALLMIQAKQLLDSSNSIQTISQLNDRKKEFQDFVRNHYQDLKHSDMIRRLLSQYFMMHEYVSYHVKGAPAADIRKKYRDAVLAGVGSWLKILKNHIPEHEILNYCVSLYYNRSMVTLASLIIENFRDVAYCPGVEKEKFSFTDDLAVTDADGNRKRRLAEFKGDKIIAFVSDDCSVSMVETISKARDLADRKKDVVVIVAPLQKLSEKHLVMSRMVSNGNMFFINDEKWRRDKPAKNIKLPLFVRIGDFSE